MPKIMENFLEHPPSYEQLDQWLTDLGAWESICIVDKDTPISTGKKGSFLGIPDEHGGMPILRCPSFFECLTVPTWMKDMFSGMIDFNIVKVQKYTNNVIGINKHADKGIDLMQNAPIFFYRINKSDTQCRSLCTCDKNGMNEQTFRLKSNTLVQYDYMENLQTLHYVPAEEGECISFVFRLSGTYRLPTTGQIYGIGGKFKTYEERIAATDLPAVDIRAPAMQEEIVKLYHIENTTDLTTSIANDLYESIRSCTF